MMLNGHLGRQEPGIAGLLFPVFLLLATCLVYANSLLGAFQYDDYLVIVNNPEVHSWGAWWSDVLRGGIRPVLKATYTLNWTTGPSPFGFHLFNLLVHAGNAVMLYALALNILDHVDSVRPGAKSTVSFFAALLFTVHPVQTEAVTYVSGRSVSLMAFFFLGALLAYIRGRESSRPMLLYILSPCLFVAGLGVKEVAVILPVVLLLWELTVKRELQPWHRILRYQSVHWGLLAAGAAGLLFNERYQRFFAVSFEVRGLYENLLSQINGVAYLLSRLILLHRLNFDPDLPVFTKWYPVLILEAVFLAGLLCLGVFSLRKRPWLCFGIIWFFIQLLPTNSLVPRMDIANERAVYLAGWGLFLAFAISLFAARKVRPTQARAAAVVLCLLLSGFTVGRNQIYHSQVSLWEDTVAKSPMKPRAHNNLGCSYVLAGRPAEARSEFQMALRLDPYYAYARDNLSAGGSTMQFGRQTRE